MPRPASPEPETGRTHAQPCSASIVFGGIPFAIVCASAFAQILPIHPDTETRAAMAWAFSLIPPPDPRTPKPDMHRPGHMGEARGAGGGAVVVVSALFIAAQQHLQSQELSAQTAINATRLATERNFQLQAAPEFDRVLQQGFTDYAKLSPFEDALPPLR